MPWQVGGRTAGGHDAGGRITLHFTALMANDTQIRTLLLGLLLTCLPGLAAASRADDEYFELYGEERPRTPDAPGRQETDVRLPPYPDPGRAIAVDLDLGRLSYRAFVDPQSLSVGEEGVVRYTLLLRSPGGVVNVFFEGVRCGDGQYRRYAYGIDGRWKRYATSRWRYIRRNGDPVHFSLADDFLCPLPDRNPVERLLDRLRRPNPKTDFSDQE